MNHARLENGIVAEIIPPLAGFTLEQRFHADFAAKCVPCGDDVETGWVFDGTGFLPPSVAEASVESLLAHAAAVRWAAETGGVLVDGREIATDRESQAMIAGAYSYAQANPEAAIHFKTRDGFVLLGSAAVQSMAMAVAEHVQACFAKESDAAAKIKNGTIVTREQVEAVFAA